MATPSPENQLPPVPRITKTGFADPVWPRWLNELRSRVIRTVLSLKIATANGFNGVVATDSLGNAVVTLGVTVSGMLKGSSGGIVAAVAGVDFVRSLSVTAPVQNTGTAADPVIAMTQSGASSNGWLSSTDWNAFHNKLDGTGIIAGTYTKVTVNSSGLVTAGGSINSGDVTTALGYTPAHSGANSDITSLTGLTTPLAVSEGGTGSATLTAHAVLLGEGTSAVGAATIGTAGRVLTDNGAGADPSFQAIPSQAGRLLNVQILTAGATYTKTAGTNSQIVELQGPGGGGGGTQATGVGQSAVASGGSAGAYAMVYFAAAVTGITVTLPAGGAGGAAGNNNGTAGAAATFGTLISCPGGGAGIGGAATNVVTATPGAAITAAPTITSGTVVKSVGGAAGQTGIILSVNGFTWGGAGGGAAFDYSVTQNRQSAGAGLTAGAFGQGGGGANQPTASSAANAGGAGGGSICVVWEYA